MQIVIKAVTWADLIQLDNLFRLLCRFFFYYDHLNQLGHFWLTEWKSSYRDEQLIADGAFELLVALVHQLEPALLLLSLCLPFFHLLLLLLSLGRRGALFSKSVDLGFEHFLLTNVFVTIGSFIRYNGVSVRQNDSKSCRIRSGSC